MRQNPNSIQKELRGQFFAMPIWLLDHSRFTGLNEKEKIFLALVGHHSYSKPYIKDKEISWWMNRSRKMIISIRKSLLEKGYIETKTNGHGIKYNILWETIAEKVPKGTFLIKPVETLPRCDKRLHQKCQKVPPIYKTNKTKKLNTSYSLGKPSAPQKKNSLNSKNKDILTLKIYPKKKNKPSASKGKFFDSSFISDSFSLSDYYTKKGFGKSHYSPLVLDKYTKLKKKGIPVDTKSLVSLIDRWNSYLDENGEKIKLRKGIVLNKHTFDPNLTLLHLQSTITYMTKIKGFSTEEMIKGVENFLGLYVNGHSYNIKANLVDALTMRKDIFLKCIDGSINKMPNFYSTAKERRDLKYFVKKGLRELGRNASEEDEFFARGYGARSEYERYLEKTDLTIEEIKKKISEESKLLKGE